MLSTKTILAVPGNCSTASGPGKEKKTICAVSNGVIYGSFAKAMNSRRSAMKAHARRLSRRMANSSPTPSAKSSCARLPH